MGVWDQLFDTVQATQPLHDAVCVYVCVCVFCGGVGATGLGTGSSLSSLTQQCTCDHSDILFESIKVLSGGSVGGEGVCVGGLWGRGGFAILIPVN